MKPDNIIQKDILKFLMKHEACFSDFKHEFKLPSNKLSYHLNMLVKKGIIAKNNGKYYLAEAGQKTAPYIGLGFPHPLIVILVIPYNNGKALLRMRRKEAFRGYWAIPSKKLNFGEKPNIAAIKIIENAGLEAKEIKFMRSISEVNVEHERAKYHFVFLLYKAKAEGIAVKGYKWFGINQLPKKTIPTDAHMIKTMDKRSFEQIGMNIEKNKLVFLER